MLFVNGVTRLCHNNSRDSSSVSFGRSALLKRTQEKHERCKHEKSALRVSNPPYLSQLYRRKLIHLSPGGAYKFSLVKLVEQRYGTGVLMSCRFVFRFHFLSE